MDKIQTGGLLDTRLEEDKLKDFLHEELAQGVDTVTWETKTKFKEYYPYNQDRSLSCVAGGGAITEEHFAKSEGQTFIPSRKDIYIRRFNRPQGGMAMHDLFNICIKGMAAESQVPSQGLSETPMNTEYPITSDIVATRATHNFKAWVSIQNFKDENTLASIVDHTPIVAFWYISPKFDYQEWWNEKPQVIDTTLGLYASDTLRHQVTIVDRTIIDGKKYFVVQDTAGVGTGFGMEKNLRLVDMDFIKARIYAAGYGINNVEVPVTDKPKVLLYRTLKVGMKDDDVKDLQAVLIYEKLLAIQKPTGLFGGMTRAAVIKLQEKYASEILKPVGLKKGTGICASRTIAWINEKYK